MRFPIVQNRKIWYSLSGTLFVLTILGAIFFGFNLSLHFTGGTEVKYSFANTVPTVDTMQKFITKTEEDFNKDKKDKLNLGTVLVLQTDTNSLSIKMRSQQSATGSGSTLSTDFENMLSTKVTSDLKGVKESSFTLSPSVGEVLKTQALWATFLAIIAIVLYIVFAFRKLPKAYNPWVFGFNTIFALVHDVVIMTGVFIFLGKFFNVEIAPYFITALLTILGYSVNDTIVVFDRVRENMILQKKVENIEEITEESVWQTMARSINTSLTVIITLTALIIFGAESTRMFAVALLVGVLVGTYSSIFLATPLLVTFKKYLLRK